MYICNRCGKLIDELPTSSQCHGYTGLGDELREEFAETECSCGGEFVEARQCKICGEYYSDEDYPYDVCECCAEEYETVGHALEYGEQRKEKVEINGFIYSVLSNEQINEILTKWVEENFTDHSKYVRDYCEDDKFDFSEFCIEKYEQERASL